MTRRYNRSRRPRKSQGALISKIAFAAVVIFLAALAIYAGKRIQSESETTTGVYNSDSLLAVVTPPDLPALTVDYEGFTVSFNTRMHVPNYVAWELTADEAAATEVTRNNAKFRQDTAVDGCPTTDDYRNSSFDRGHMCPAADMKWSRKAMDDCHYLTNIAPQTHKLNGGPWQTVEANCRKWAERDSALIIICGPILTDRLTSTIGANGVIVPERFFKVVYAPYANPPRGIAFILNNFDTTGGAQAGATTIDEVEAITSFDFFSALPDEIENKIESESNYQLWQRLKSR
ncbi:MAG: DNA/RNA non-specific endonuclease [Muribaculaceae bacterium]|nr:DNA/RNA non-specific endonuclease [Muribaculaceae bacterium]